MNNDIIHTKIFEGAKVCGVPVFLQIQKKADLLKGLAFFISILEELNIKHERMQGYGIISRTAGIQ